MITGVIITWFNSKQKLKIVNHFPNYFKEKYDFFTFYNKIVPKVIKSINNNDKLSKKSNNNNYYF